MTDRPIAITLYRLAITVPPGDDEYQTAQERYGDPPEGASDALRDSWTAHSSYESEAAIRKKAATARKSKRFLGNVIVRYHIPEGSGLTWTPSFKGGHYDIHGDASELRTYLDTKWFAEVEQSRAEREGGHDI